MTQKFFYLHSVCVSTGEKKHSTREAKDIQEALASRMRERYPHGIEPVAWSHTGWRVPPEKIRELHDEAIAAGRLIVKDEKLQWRAVVPGESAAPQSEAKPKYAVHSSYRLDEGACFFATLQSPVDDGWYDCYFVPGTGMLNIVNSKGTGVKKHYETQLKEGGVAGVAAKEAQRRFVEGKATITADMSRNVSRAQAERMHEEAHAMQLAQYERESRNEKPKAPLTRAKPAPFDPFKGFFDRLKPVTVSNSERRVEKTRGAFGASPDLQATNPLVGSASLMLGMGD